MHTSLPTPNSKAIIYQDDLLYACLARYPITRGHVVVVWKKDVPDLHLLSVEEYDHLMNVVGTIRNAMLSALKISKVYLVYMDEIKHVHWHLVPRYNKKGFDVFIHEPKEISDFSLVDKIKSLVKFVT